MDETYDFLEELENFLGGTFHQDISSPEQAIDEFINEASIECLLSTIKDCEKFLNSSLTKQEKENIIQHNAEVYFPAIELTPLQWLNNLVENMKEGVKTK
ncbi:contact-dependent growth inhibition system immunity protein [Rossellomorea marisflavi]|uniref:contact-dependent growth inhibition system immunity protein n=1 Tax=Rossellomorea marisflavi TaxID=189381 RepID=UPI0028532D74|nr:contact-dependent growth inhibition system immunity protein [Rossellomorea marisflavi]MDR4938253.1 contact-dependent growth inhibition system immunity protein [Rossellomorea marisflavi]